MARPLHMETLSFDNSYARLPESFHAKLNPTPFSSAPYLISFNRAAAELIDLDPAEAARPEFAGSLRRESARAGHGTAGDAVFRPSIRRLCSATRRRPRDSCSARSQNDRGEQWDLQLKGAGMTPFSRDGDGRAVLRSTIREYLCSEAMHGLGIPTTRALCIVGSDHKSIANRSRPAPWCCAWRRRMSVSALRSLLLPQAT